MDVRVQSRVAHGLVLLQLLPSVTVHSLYSSGRQREWKEGRRTWRRGGGEAEAYVALKLLVVCTDGSIENEVKNEALEERLLREESHLSCWAIVSPGASGAGQEQLTCVLL
jgi:hypothetical protein